MGKGLANPQVEVNGLAIAIVPNSLSYDEGIGEQSVKTQSAGGSSVENVFFDDATTKFSMVKFDVYNTNKNIENARIWKTSQDTNRIEITGGPLSDLHRNFANMALTNNYEVNLKNEGVLSLEFHGRAAA